MQIQEVSPREAEKLVREGWAFIDVRSSAEWSAVHASGAKNLPLDSVSPESLRLHNPGSSKAVVICQSGGRSKKACEKLLAAEGIQAVSVLGGTMAWEQAGLPVEKGKGVISIERQVRIAAGSLVFAGTMLGLLAHGLFFVIPLFVGAGLVFAGVTDFCGMGILLARAPWNNRGRSPI